MKRRRGVKGKERMGKIRRKFRDRDVSTQMVLCWNNYSKGEYELDNKQENT